MRWKITSFLAGVAVFTVFQILIRVPLLENVLPYQNWFLQMKYGFPLLSAFFYAFTAGLFEEGGRCAGFRILGKKRYSWMNGVLFGLGHGGVEAAWIGTQLWAYRNVLTVPAALVSIFERICAIGIHVGLSLLVLYGMREKKLRYLFLAMGLHTLVNFPLPFINNVVALEGYVLLCAMAAVVYTIYSRNRLFTDRSEREKEMESL